MRGAIWIFYSRFRRWIHVEENIFALFSLRKFRSELRRNCAYFSFLKSQTRYSRIECNRAGVKWTDSGEWHFDFTIIYFNIYYHTFDIIPSHGNAQNCVRLRMRFRSENTFQPNTECARCSALCAYNLYRAIMTQLRSRLEDVETLGVDWKDEGWLEFVIKRTRESVLPHVVSRMRRWFEFSGESASYRNCRCI